MGADQQRHDHGDRNADLNGDARLFATAATVGEPQNDGNLRQGVQQRQQGGGELNEVGLQSWGLLRSAWGGVASPSGDKPQGAIPWQTKFHHRVGGDPGLGGR